MKTLKVLFCIFILISINGINSYSQDSYQGAMKFKIKVLNSEGDKIDNAIIKVYENSEEIKSIEGNPSILLLNLNKTYVIEVSDKENNKKYLLVDSTVPLNLNDKICPFSCKVKLNDDFSSLEKPVVKVFYGKRDFEFMALNK